MIDPIQFQIWQQKERKPLSPRDVRHPSGPHNICTCKTCQETIYQHATKPKFSDYTNVNPLIVESLTEHQYFLCDQMVEAFLFKLRSWRRFGHPKHARPRTRVLTGHHVEFLHIDGFREATFGSGLFDNLVLKNSTKDLIKDLTQMYIGDSCQPVSRADRGLKKVTQVHKFSGQRKADTKWSADFVEGKGEGLTILLHGRPGVGKTYTAGKCKVCH